MTADQRASDLLRRRPDVIAAGLRWRLFDLKRARDTAQEQYLAAAASLTDVLDAQRELFVAGEREETSHSEST